MTQQIRAGDLVCVVRTCCDAVYAEMGGRIAVVVWVTNKTTFCKDCGHANYGPHAGSAFGKAGAPTPWLQRIEPLPALDELARGQDAAPRLAPTRGNS